MSTVNEVTQAMGLPLPHPNNFLAEDVLRLREVLHLLDDVLSALHNEVSKKADGAITQVSLTNISNQINALGNAVTELGTGKVASVNGIKGVNITLLPEHISLGPANGPENITYNYDSNGRINQITQKINGSNAITAYSYDGQGRITQIQTSYKSRVRTQIFTYNASGNLTGSTATEIQG